MYDADTTDKVLATASVLLSIVNGVCKTQAAYSVIWKIFGKKPWSINFGVLKKKTFDEIALE